ncbi:hypothetical protein QBC34DRAFT_452985 [Podospora aff. communis PSN243]|uniref:Calcineurin-like phosphoesterase domain-containing protein n=1 Tax=Podospora aff. communis PSN243 TaxID=3040156 RepID=A0AAV9G5B8_9PEZI|nr:hypothetical protein QBC34DRAFT_452985 [Podospora aff. communis PSN243]
MPLTFSTHAQNAHHQFQIVSDLHLEIAPNNTSYTLFTIPPRAPHLALLGDIGVPATQDPLTGPLASFLRRHLLTFTTIFLHPRQPRSLPLQMGRRRPLLRTLPEASGSAVGEFIYLQKGRYDFSEDAVTVLGCTLFSRIPSGEFQQLGLGLNDFHLTTSWTPRQHARAHEEHLGWLNGQVRELEGSGRKVVVFTHYAPTKDERTVEERHWGSVLQSGFSTDLSGEACWTAGEVTVWAFGHTHFNCDFVDGLGKKVVTNQKGYDFQGRGTAGWDPEKVVEV